MMLRQRYQTNGGRYKPLFDEVTWVVITVVFIIYFDLFGDVQAESVEECLLNACYKDDICKENLRLYDPDFYRNIVFIEFAVNSVVDMKLITSSELDELCKTNSTHSALLLRFYQNCPLNYVYNRSSRQCICRAKDLCNTTDTTSNRNTGGFLLVILVSVTFILLIIALYNTALTFANHKYRVTRNKRSDSLR